MHSIIVILNFLMIPNFLFLKMCPFDSLLDTYIKLIYLCFKMWVLKSDTGFEVLLSPMSLLQIFRGYLAFLCCVYFCWHEYGHI